MVTVSALPRAEACIASVVLPQVDEGSGLYAAHGNAVHDFLDAIAKGTTREQALAAVVLQHRQACAAINLELVPHNDPEAWASELAMVLDWETGRGRFVKLAGHRQYGEMGPTEIPGTADLVGRDDDRVIILDVKTGFKWLGDPRDSLQLGAYAVAAASALGCSSARVGFLYVHEGEEPRLVVDDLTAEDLAAMAERIAGVMRSIDWAKTTGDFAPHLGDHCTYCPAFRACPAKRALWDAFLSNHLDTAKAALGADMSTLDGVGTVLPIEKTPRALDLLKQVRNLADILEKEVKDQVRAFGPVPIEGRPNYVLAEVECSTETLDGIKAFPVLVEMFADMPDAVADAVKTTVTVTKDAIDELVHKRAEKTKERIGALNKTVLEAIRAAGGSRQSYYLNVKPVKRSK
jgi:RecB family exonuclease